MKADQYGTPSEQCRHQAGWRNSEKGSGRCDGCEHVALDAGGNGKTKAHCNHLDLATKGNAVCDWYEPIPMPKNHGPAMGKPLPNSPEANGWRIECGVYLMSCACCAHLNLSGNQFKCGLTDFVTAPTSGCDRHEYQQQASTATDPSESNGWRTFAGPDDPQCRTCVHLGTPMNSEQCDLTGFVSTPGSTCNQHTPKPQEQPVTIHKKQLDALTDGDRPTDSLLSPLDRDPALDLPIVGEMIEATQPDKAVPVLKSTGTEIEVYDQRRIVNECRFYMGQSAEAMLEAGKRLIQIKENEEHGEFQRILEDELGLATRTARQMMQAALKFTAGEYDQAPKRRALAVLGKAKLLDLMAESDEDLDELTEGGKLAGKTLDEIDRMTTRELKAELRKRTEDARQREESLKADLEATRKRIAKKDEKINELEERLENKPTLPDTAEADKYATDLNIEADAIFARINASLRGRCLAVRDSHHDARAEHGRLLIAQALGRIISGARIVAADLDIMPDEDATDAFNHGADGDDGDIWDAVNAAQGQG